jgi:uncharacterized protein YaaW (UPF0174 family)
VCPISRKGEELVSLLKLAGFVDVIAKEILPVTDQDLNSFFQLWGVSQKGLDKGMASRLSGKFGFIRLSAKKPSYNIGQKMTINFQKKPLKTTKAEKKKAWLISTNDDDEGINMELEDEEGLLNEQDKIKPSKDSLIRMLLHLYVLVIRL